MSRNIDEDEFIRLCDESPKIAICTQHMMFGCFRDSECRSSGNKD